MMKIININDYTDTTENCTPAVVRAICEVNDDCENIIVFDRGAYHFYPEGTTQAEFYPSNNDGGMKKIVFPIFGKKHVTIDGGGSEFIFHGRISPFILWNAEDITIKNFTIDFSRSCYGQGRITAADDFSFDLSIDKTEFPYHINNGILVFEGEFDEFSTVKMPFLVQEFDPVTTGPGYNTSPMFIATGKTEADLSILPVKTMQLAMTEKEDGTLHFENKMPEVIQYRFHVGYDLNIKYENRENAGFFVLDSKATVIENITVYRCPGMGVIGQTSENITVKGVKMINRIGRGGLVSVNDDATHFVNCTGKISLIDNVFDNMMDDATNIHGIYTKIKEMPAPNQIVVSLMHFQQYGVNIYKPGDTIELLKNGSLKTLARPIVVCAQMSEDKKSILLTFASNVAGCVEIGDIVENAERMPEAYLVGNHTGNNRPRGFLLTTPKKVLIENNTFYNSGFGIHITSDGTYWFESGRVKDITIKNNRFINCAYAWGDYVIAVTPEFPSIPNVQIHRNINIENNYIESFQPGIVYAFSVDGLRVRNNTWVETDAYPKRGTETHTYKLVNCKNVELDGNRYITH